MVLWKFFQRYQNWQWFEPNLLCIFVLEVSACFFCTVYMFILCSVTSPSSHSFLQLVCMPNYATSFSAHKGNTIAQRKCRQELWLLSTISAMFDLNIFQDLHGDITICWQYCSFQPILWHISFCPPGSWREWSESPVWVIETGQHGGRCWCWTCTRDVWWGPGLGRHSHLNTHTHTLPI